MTPLGLRNGRRGGASQDQRPVPRAPVVSLLGPAAFRKLLDRFYREATNVLVARDAVLDKFVGDEVVALFLPVLNGDDHPSDAIEGARALLTATVHGT